MYCVYCNENHDEATTVFDLEHIIQESMGGTRTLGIRVCKSSNSRLGTEVDAPFVDSFLMQLERFNNGLTKHIRLSGHVEVNGEPRRARLDFGSGALRVEPKVQRIDHPDGTIQWNIQAVGEADARRILNDLNRKVPQGYKPVDIDAELAAGEWAEVAPPMAGSAEVNLLEWGRAFAKVALSLGHRELGEQFSRSVHADRLRQVLQRGYSGEVPGYLDIERLPNRLGIESMHVVAIDPDLGLFMGVLFGSYGAVVPIGKYPGLKNVVHIVDPSRRALRSTTMQEHARHMMWREYERRNWSLLEWPVEQVVVAKNRTPQRRDSASPFE